MGESRASKSMRRHVRLVGALLVGSLEGHRMFPHRTVQSVSRCERSSSMIMIRRPGG